MGLHVKPDDPMPLYAQLVHQLRLGILSGELRPGEQLPTVRQLAVDLAINTNTVARAYAELHRAGWIETRQGRGTFVVGAIRPPPRTDRTKRLQGVAQTAIAEAAALSFGPDELIRAIEEQIKGEQ